MEDFQLTILRLASFNVHTDGMPVYVHVYSKTRTSLGSQSSLPFKF